MLLVCLMVTSAVLLVLTAAAGIPRAHADSVAYLIDVTVRPGYNFANADDALAYGQQLCDKVSQDRTYADLIGDVKSDFNTSDEFQASYLIDKAVKRTVSRPDLAAAQLGGALPTARGMTGKTRRLVCLIGQPYC
jgi:hypothetical protein